MKYLLTLVTLVIGMSVAFGQKTIRTNFSFAGETDIIMKWEFSQDYNYVKMSMKNGEYGSYEEGKLLKVLDVSVDDGCAFFKILGADGKVFTAAKCEDGSFAYEADGEIYSASKVKTWDNNL